MNALQPTRIVSLALAVAMTSSSAMPAQTSRWASPDEPVAKSLIDFERLWAESACTHSGIEKTILAEDFYGIAPDGSQYDRKQALANGGDSAPAARDCRMFEVKVHFFGSDVAVLYGSESAIYAARPSDPKEHTVKLTWTDTWLKRNGKWQIIAAQDMPSEEK